MKRDLTTGQNHSDSYCYFYLHTSGALILKPKYCNTLDFEESDFVVKYWLIDLNDRLDLYNFLIAARRLEAGEERVKELAEKWGITNEDCKVYCAKSGLNWEYVDDNTKLRKSFPYRVFEKSDDNIQRFEGYGSTLFDALCAYFRKEIEVE